MKKIKSSAVMLASFLILVLFSSYIVEATTMMDVRKNPGDLAIEVDSANFLDSFEKNYGINVSQELEKYLDELNHQLEEVKEEEKQKIRELIIGVEESMNSIKEFKTIQDLNTKEEETTSPSSLLPPVPSIPVVTSASAAVASTIAYFKANGYNLAAELLTHARKNTVSYSSYRPTTSLTNQIRNTTLFQNLITYNHSSSNKFTSSNSNSDLYYSIHRFEYTVTGNGSTRIMSITDLYNFDSTSVYPPSLGNVMINWMLMAQNIGIIKPYWLNITVSRY